MGFVRELGMCIYLNALLLQLQIVGMDCFCNGLGNLLCANLISCLICEEEEEEEEMALILCGVGYFNGCGGNLGI
uniref:Uncharacterized protein n=1 Tax=Manihot esculenta TaxID=3983 RepID=A0A2C9VQ21_MANES